MSSTRSASSRVEKRNRGFYGKSYFRYVKVTPRAPRHPQRSGDGAGRRRLRRGAHRLLRRGPPPPRGREGGVPCCRLDLSSSGRPHPPPTRDRLNIHLPTRKAHTHPTPT